MDVHVVLTRVLVKARNNVLNIAMGMIIGLLILFSVTTAWAEPETVTYTAIRGDLNVPNNYQTKQQWLQNRDQMIPTNASQTTSPGAFGAKVLEYHLADMIENNKFKPLESVKSLEKAVNGNTQVETDNFKIKSKLDVNRMKAEMDIETFITTKIWTENSFKTLRTQMKLYDIEGGFISLQNKSDNVDTRTYLNIEKTW